MKTNKKISALIALFMGVCWGVTAQNVKRGFDWDRVVYGGSILPVFSNIGTTIAANPFVGYKVTDRLVPGIMLTYNYSRLRDWPIVGQTSTYSALGVSPFVRYSIMNGFFAQAEYEFLNGNFKVEPPTSEASFSENNLFLGGGYVNQIPGTRGGIFAQVMYNVTWQGASGNSVYSSPLIYRVGFTLF